MKTENFEQLHNFHFCECQEELNVNGEEHIMPNNPIIRQDSCSVRNASNDLRKLYAFCMFTLPFEKQTNTETKTFPENKIWCGFVLCA